LTAIETVLLANTIITSGIGYTKSVAVVRVDLASSAIGGWVVLTIADTSSTLLVRRSSIETTQLACGTISSRIPLIEARTSITSS